MKSEVSIRIPDFFKEIFQTHLKLYRTIMPSHLHIAKAVPGKKKMGSITFLKFKLYYKAAVIKVA